MTTDGAPPPAPAAEEPTPAPPAAGSPASAPPAPVRFTPPLRLITAVLVTIALAWVIYVLNVRMAGAFDPWASDPDQRQAVWHYWRYTVDGAFPPGDLLTDYAFVMHAPPVWWVLMASLSTLFDPLVAAKVLNVVSTLATAAVAFMAVRARGGPFVAAAAVFLLFRNDDFYLITAGGYARSFGPFLVLLFLWCWHRGWERRTLAVLVFQAAFYPSVVIACGLTYGAYTVLAGPTMKARLRRMTGMLIAGLLVIGFGLSQDIAAKDWWGGIVSEAEAMEMPAWRPGGRVNEVPLRSWRAEMKANFTRAFRPAGAALVEPWGRVDRRHDHLPLVGVFGAFALAAAVATLLQRRRRAATATSDTPGLAASTASPTWPTPHIPWQPFALMLGAVVAYFLARQVAFKLYLPYRSLSHVVPYCIYVLLPLVCAAGIWRVTRRPFIADLLGALVAVALIVGAAGAAPKSRTKTYTSYAGTKPLYEAIRKLPIEAQLAGELAMLDNSPLYSWHRIYVNKVLAHPFRKGFYAEAERRLLRMHDAIYATTFEDVLRFADEEHVDYLVLNGAHFDAVDRRLFEPVKRQVVAWFRARRGQGFALQQTPEEAIVARHGRRFLVDVEKLRAAVAAGRAPLRPKAPAQPASDPSGPPDPGPVLAPDSDDVDSEARE